MPSQASCLECGRVFPPKIDGEIAVGGYLLCKGCGAIMIWADDMTLRELTASERIDAGANQGLMMARHKILPDRSIRHRGTSLVTTGLMVAIIVMVALERTGVVPPLHQRGASTWHKRPAPVPWPGGRP